MPYVPTEEHATKLLEVVGHGLSNGLGVAKPGEMCIEAAVCYALGLPHGDDPVLADGSRCVLPAVRSLKITINDWTGWKSSESRAKALIRLGLAQLGSDGVVDSVKFAEAVSMLVIRTCVADALRRAAKMIPAHTASLNSAADTCSHVATIGEASSAADSAYSAASSARSAYSAARSALSAARSAADSAADSAAYSAAYSAADSARSAADSAADSARSAADSAADSARSAADSAAEKVMSDFCEGVVQILIEMTSPGTQFLYLTEGVAL